MDTEMAETVYGTPMDDSHVMSERVQTLAASIYKEFERMIQKYDENVVKELMPLVVGILEGLDQSYQEKQENDVELELLRDDNEQLLTQYEREKQLRKASEQKFLEVEDVNEGERRELQGKVESLESIVRMFELKAKNAQDHVCRLEDKEAEMKKEYNKLHERYTELFRTHMEHIERTKLLMGGDKFLLDSGMSPRGRSGFPMPQLRPVGMNIIYDGGQMPTKSGTSPPSFNMASPNRAESNTSLRNELNDLEKGQMESKLDKENRNKSRTETAEKEQITDSIDMRETSTGTKEGSQTSENAVQDSNMCTQDAESEQPSQNVVDNHIDNTAQTTGQDKLQNDVTLGSRVLISESQSHEPVQNEIPAESHTTRVADKSISEQDESIYHSFNNTYIGDAILQSPELEDMDPSIKDQAKASPLHIAGASSQNESSLFDELSVQDVDALGDIDDGCDITGMSKEVENLILENTELLATKNALNVVKDDLIAKVDELSSEHEILTEEINSLQMVKEKMKKRVTELEEEVKKYREELEKEKNKKLGEGGKKEKSTDSTLR